MSKTFRVVFYLLSGLYLVALFIWATGTYGWFGQERDPLSGVFLIPLGLPWNRASSWAPDGMLLWISLFAPLINLLLTRVLVQYFSTSEER